MSRLDDYTNISVYTILAIQILCALALALIGQTWMMRHVYNPLLLNSSSPTKHEATYLHNEVDPK